MESEIISMEEDLSTATNEISSLKSEVQALQNSNGNLASRISSLEGMLSCPSGSSLTICGCPPGMANVPHINGGECVSISENR